MFGWINLVIRDLLIKRHGDDAWAEVCLDMCIPKSTTFPRNEYFSDASSIALISAASKVLKVHVDEMKELLGAYFIVFLREDGYENLLRCMGDSVKEWLSNISHLHAYLGHARDVSSHDNQHPRFWVTADRLERDASNSSQQPRRGAGRGVVLHHQSTQGPLLAPVAVGMIREATKTFFSTAVTFERISTQGENGAKSTSWRLRGDKPLDACLVKTVLTSSSRASSSCRPPARLPQLVEEKSTDDDDDDGYCAVQNSAVSPKSTSSSPLSSPMTTPHFATPTLSNRQMKQLFPFCLVFDETMKIIDCGDALVEVLESSPIGSYMPDLLKLDMPVGDLDTWDGFLQCLDMSSVCAAEACLDEGVTLPLKGQLSISDDGHTGFYMCHADVYSLEEMKQSRVRPRHLTAQPCHMQFMLKTELLTSDPQASLKMVNVQKGLEELKVLRAKMSREISAQATKHAEQSLENKRTFVRYISHEIRTPLTVVKLGLKLALQEAKQMPVDDDFLNNITDCEDSINVAVAILDDLLVYEKLDSGILEMFKEIIVVIPFVIRSLRPFEKQAKLKNITFKIEHDCHKDMSSVVIYADKSKMSQAIRNFISNSLKFTPENGTVTVRISLVVPQKRRRANSDEASPGNSGANLSIVAANSLIAGASRSTTLNTKERRFLRCTSADSMFTMSCGKVPAFKTVTSEFDDAEFQLLAEVIVIEFIDSGIGISEENQKKLFRDNVQFNPHVTQEGGGSGLGLWITNGIVKLHDGYVDVRSNPEGQAGITFSLELPIYRRAVHSISRQSSYMRDSSSSEDEDDDKEDDEVCEVRISTTNVADLHMELDDSLDEKLLMESMANEKLKRIVKQQEQQVQQESQKSSLQLPPPPPQQMQHQRSQEQPSQMHLVVDTDPLPDPPRPIEMRPLHGCRVLLIDDSKMILRVTSKMLSSLGVVCDTALDGEQGVEKIKKECRRGSLLQPVDAKKSSQDNNNSSSGDGGGGGGRRRSRSGSVDMTDTPVTKSWDNDYYDLVMLDKQMPVMDGLQTCQELRQMGYTGTIIGVTGSCMPSEVEEFRRVGIDEVFSKPLDMCQLESYFSRIKREKSKLRMS